MDAIIEDLWDRVQMKDSTDVSLKYVINLIKTGNVAMSGVVIQKLNNIIRARNKYKPSHGIIVQLRKDNWEKRDLTLVYKVKCGVCENVQEFEGYVDGDIYAPVCCATCKSVDLFMTN
jgi:hypothetical protein